MFKRFLCVLIFLLSAIALGKAQNVSGLIVQYIDSDTEDYVQAISNLGRISFSGGEAFLSLSDGTSFSLGKLDVIRKMCFGSVDESQFQKTTAVAPISLVKISAYPNPAYDHIHISGVKDGCPVSILNITGTVLLSGVTPDINIAALSRGVYFVLVDKTVVRIIKK